METPGSADFPSPAKWRIFGKYTKSRSCGIRDCCAMDRTRLRSFEELSESFNPLNFSKRRNPSLQIALAFVSDGTLWKITRDKSPFARFFRDICPNQIIPQRASSTKASTKNLKEGKLGRDTGSKWARSYTGRQRRKIIVIRSFRDKHGISERKIYIYIYISLIYG